MRPRPWTSTRRLLAGLQIGAVATLLVLTPGLPPTPPVFAHELPRWVAATPPPPSAKDRVEPEGTLDILHEDRENDGSHAGRGDDVELEGTLEIQIEDREDGSEAYHHVLSTHDGRRLSLEGVRHPDLLTGDLMRVRGITSGQKLQLQTTSAKNVEVLQYAPLASTFGPQKVVVLLVNFSNDPSRPFTVSDMRDWMTFSDDFYRDNSYGQTSLSVDVFGWYTLPMTNAGCPTATIKARADQAATAAGVNVSAYPRRVYFFPHTSACSFSGRATLGGNPSSAWINGSVAAITHELGHNFGLYHSHSMSCAPAILSVSGCTTAEYGDTPDMMGGLGGPFNAFQKQRLGWLGFGVSPPITNVTQSGTYTLDGYSSLGTLPKALKIQRGATSQASFFVELRTPCPGCLEPGVYIRLATDGVGNSSYLLDMTPATPMWSGATLDVGRSFTDPVSGITIQTVSVSSTSATIMVDIGGTGPTCTRSAPSVIGSPGQSPAVQSGTMVTYNVSVTNNDSAGCSASTFTLQATAPTTSWQKSFGASSVTTNPGATSSTTLQVTSPSVPTGSYAIVSAATRTTASPLSGSGSVLYNVAPDGPPVPPPPPGNVTLTITTNSPIGREMTFHGTLTGSTSLSATVDGIAIAAKFVVVDATRKTWTVKATGLFAGPHTFTVASGTLAVSRSFTVQGVVPASLPSTPTALVAGAGPQLTWTPGTPVTQTGFVVERAAGPTVSFASIATTTAPSYLDASGVEGQCYRVRATNAAGTSGPSNVACATTPPPPSPGDVTLTITTNSPIGREMTFGGTLTGSTSLSATVDGIAVAAKYIVVDATRKTWTVKAAGLFAGPHIFTVASGTLAVSRSFTVLK